MINFKLVVRKMKINKINQRSLYLQLLVVVENVWEVKWVVRKGQLGGTKKLKKLSVQRKLRLDLD